MGLETVRREAIQVVGMHIQTQPMSPAIPALWPKFVPRIGEIGAVREPGVSYGVMWHDGGTVLNYMAAVSVVSPGAVPAGMRAVTLPAGEYATFRYPLSGLTQGFCEIFDKLLPASGFVQAPGPFFERYDETFDPNNAGSLVEICLPVKAAAAPARSSPGAR